MIAKIWNYSGWINDPDVYNITHGFRNLFRDIAETVINSTEAEQQDMCSLCWITEHIMLMVVTNPCDGCAFLNVTSTEEEKLYDFLSVMPDYFDILINDADNNIYPAHETALMKEAEGEMTEAQESNIKDDLYISQDDESEKVQIKISSKWMLHQFRCTEDYIKNVCHGSCCTGADKVLISLLPQEAKRQVELGCKVTDNKLCPDNETGKCPHLNDCGLCDIHFTPDKPFGCIASPFTLNKSNTLVIRHRYSRMKCHGDGEYAYKTFRASLDLILGKEEAQRVCDYYDQGNSEDIYANISRANIKRLAYLDGLKHEQK